MTELDALSLLAKLRAPVSPLRPEHLLLPSFSIAPPLADDRRLTIGDHEDRRRPALLLTPSVAQLRQKLLRVIEKKSEPAPPSLDGEPLPRLAQRLAEMEAAAAPIDPDPRAALAEAHAELARRIDAETEDSNPGVDRGGVAAQAHASLLDFCASSLFLTPAGLAELPPPPSQRLREGSPSRSAAEARSALLYRLDLQIQLRLALAAIGVAASACNEPVSRKPYGEVKRLLQLYGVKLAAAAAAAAGGSDDEEDEEANAEGAPNAVGTEAPPPQQQQPTTATAAAPAAASTDDQPAPPSAPWASIDDYVMRLLRPRFGEALPRTLARLIGDFHEESLEPTGDHTARLTSSALASHEPAAADASSTLAAAAAAAGPTAGALVIFDEPPAAPVSAATSVAAAIAAAGPAAGSGAAGAPPFSGMAALKRSGSQEEPAGATAGGGSGGAALSKRPPFSGMAALKRSGSQEEPAGGGGAPGVANTGRIPLVRASTSESVVGLTARVGSHADKKSIADLKLEIDRQKSQQLKQPKKQPHGASHGKKKSTSGKHDGAGKQGADGARHARGDVAAPPPAGPHKRRRSHKAAAGADDSAYGGGDERKRTHPPPAKVRRLARGFEEEPAGAAAGSSHALVCADSPAFAVPPAGRAVRHHRGGDAGASSFALAVSATPQPARDRHGRPSARVRVAASGGLMVAETPTLSVMETPRHPSCAGAASSLHVPASASAAGSARGMHHPIIVQESPLLDPRRAMLGGGGGHAPPRPAGALHLGLQAGGAAGGASSSHHANVTPSPPMLLGYSSNHLGTAQRLLQAPST